MRTVDSIGVDLFVEGADSIPQMLKFKEALTSTITSVAKWAAATAAAGLSIKAIVNGLQEWTTYAAELKDVQDRTGESIENLSVWGRAVEAVGGDAKAFVGTVERMSRSIQDAFIEQGPFLTYMSQLGVQLRTDNGELRQTSDILKDLASKWKNFTSSERAYIADKLGIDQDTFRLLNKGGAEIDRLVDRFNKYGKVTQEMADRADRVRTLWATLVATLKGSSAATKDFILQFVEPVLIELDKLTLWVLDNKPKIIAFFVDTAKAIGSWTFDSVNKLLSDLEAGFAGLGEWAKKFLDIGPQIRGVFSAILDNFAGLITGDATARENILASLRKVKDAYFAYLKALKDIDLVEVGRRIWAGLQAGWEKGWSAFKGLLASADDLFKSYFNFSLYDKGKAVFESLKSGALAGLNVVKHYITGENLTEDGAALIDSFLSGMQAAWENVKAWFRSLDQLIQGFIGFSLYDKGAAVFASLEKGFRSGWNAIKHFLSGEKLTEEGKAFIESFKAGVTSAWNSMKATFTSGMAAVRNFLFGEKLDKEGNAVVMSFEDGMKNRWEGLKSWLAGVDGRIKEHFGFSLYEVGAELFNSLWEGIKAKFAEIENFIATFDWFGAGEGIGQAIRNWLTGEVELSDFQFNLLTAINRVREVVFNAIGGIVLAISGLVYDLVANAWSALWAKIDELTGGLVTKVEGIVKSVIGPIKDALQWVDNASNRILSFLPGTGAKVADTPPPAPQAQTANAPLSPSASPQAQTEEKGWWQRGKDWITGAGSAMGAMADTIAGTVPTPAAAAATSAANSTTYNQQRGPVTVTNTTTVGTINIDAAGGDSKEIASGMRNALEQNDPMAYAVDGANKSG